MTGVHTFENLEVWTLAVELIRRIYGVAGALPKTEMYALGDQMRRAAVSVALNIAEGRAADGDTEFRRFLGIARRSVVEVQACMLICRSLGYLEPSRARDICGFCDKLEAKLRSFRRVLKATSTTGSGRA